jgi:hypothetical protein
MPPKKKAMAGAGVAVTLAAIVALASRDGAPPPGAEASAKAGATVVGAAAPVAAPAPAALSEQNGIVSADVPLFGPTPMATMEPAPLSPPPSPEVAAIEAAERADAQASVTAAAEDESFPDEGDSSKKGKTSKKPEDVAPWGRGKVVTPVIHRLRLDGPGDALQGSLQPTGFTVVVPERKVMEQGGGIAKRDPRIARVRTVNTPNGAQITFQFKDGVPAYRARLRRDFVEFLIGAPEKKAAAAKAPLKAAAKAKK